MRRAEDPALVRGTARFAADVKPPDALTMMVVRSPIAHGALGSLDVETAGSMPGVVAVWTAEDIVSDLGEVPRISTRLSETPRADLYLQPVLATGRVRYVGEPVAVVIAASRYSAEDAAEALFVDTDPLRPSLEPWLREDSELLFPEGNLVQSLHARTGEPGQIFDSAAVVVESSFDIGRHTAIPMEARALTVEWVPDERLLVYGSTKVPHWNRRELARQLKIDADRIVMKETAIGGGFGVRGEFYPEDFLVPWCALKLQRSIAWAEDRREHFMATNHAREQHHKASIAGDEDGNILGIRSEFWVDLGAYVRTNGLRVPENSVTWLPGPYEIEHFEGIAHCVVTNRTPTATYRAPGGVECTFVRERLLDMYAERIGVDPIELRRKNLIPPERMPYERKSLAHVPAIALDEGDYPSLFEQVVSKLNLPEVDERRSRGGAVGYGLSTFFERSGAGPSERGSVRVDSDGGIVVRSGASSVGQGLRTVLTQIVADVFDVPSDTISVELLDTSQTTEGVGSFGSRSTMMAGAAVQKAAIVVVERAIGTAAELLGIDQSKLIVSGGSVSVAEDPGRGVELSEIARRLEATAPLEATADYSVTGPIYDFGAHGAVVSIDEDTGNPTIERLVVAFDVGKAINPKLVEGQFVGAAVQGIGGALMEQLVYDDEGNPLVTSLMDYLMPTMSEVPPIDTIIDESHPTDHNPLGAKGAGEGGITGIPAAICGAIAHALSDSARITSFPVHPSQLIEPDTRRPH